MHNVIVSDTDNVIVTDTDGFLIGFCWLLAHWEGFRTQQDCKVLSHYSVVVKITH